jgi:secreted trypsin-like serine protease
VARFIRNVVAALVVSAVAVPWSAQPAGAIAHGADAADGEYRFSVLLIMTGLPAEGGGTRDSSCSGALIAPRWVITAGHCFRDAGRRVSRTVAERTTAVVGRTDLGDRHGQEVDVVAAYQADGADVALAELGEPVTGVTPIRVATQPPVRGEVLRLTGFGLVIDGGGTAPATRLQTGQFTVDAIGDALIETSGRAPRPDTSPCPHDSGGPYFRENRDGNVVLAAVVSSGPGCPHTGPDLCARVDNLSDWIAGTIASSPHGPAYARDALLLTAGIGVAALLVVGVVLRRRAGGRR